MDRGNGSERSRKRLLEVDEAARRVIVRKGLRSTTLRDISREGGFTTGVLTHYFPDKDALITGVFSSASETWLSSMRVALAEAATVAGKLIAILELNIPSKPEDRLEWRLWAEMWSYASWAPEFAAHVVETDALWEAELRGVLEAAVAEGALPATVDTVVQARIVARLLDGLGIRSLLLSDYWALSRTAFVEYFGALGLDPAVLAEVRAAAARD
jgi:AcrR family transcriptional regulator